MPVAERMAQATWEGPLASGIGTIRMRSGAAGELLTVGQVSELCPVSRMFAGAKITTDAALEAAS
jgi:hypothetical protein